MRVDHVQAQRRAVKSREGQCFSGLGRLACPPRRTGGANGSYTREASYFAGVIKDTAMNERNKTGKPELSLVQCVNAASFACGENSGKEPGEAQERRGWLLGVTEAEIAQQGSTLLALLFARAREEKLQVQELAQRLGVHPSYLGQLRLRHKYVENISMEFAEACAEFLGMPVLAVLVAAGQLKEKHFREPVNDSMLLRQALETILRDPIIGPIFPPELLQQNERLQRAFVILYERATNKRLLGGRVSAADLVTFAKTVPKPFGVKA